MHGTFFVYRDEAGLVTDFFALRHMFIANPADSGVHPKVAQILARHSTITLRMGCYAHGTWGDEARRGRRQGKKARSA